MTDAKREVSAFLASRRAKITPEQAGLPNYGGHRRVPGLRREEAALLAGVSPDYWVRIERGNLSGVSEQVLDAIARALQLDDAERAHLFSLARAANASPSSRQRRPVAQKVRPGVQRVLDAISAPAWIRNGRADVMAANHLGRALYSPLFDSAAQPPNTARFFFLDEAAARQYYVDWDKTANDMVAILRAESGRNPSKELSELVGHLSVRSSEFSRRWAAHDVRFHRTGRKTLNHPVVGELDLSYEAFELPAEPGLTMLVYTAEPASKTQDALNLLSSWAATEFVAAEPETASENRTT